MSGQDTPSAPVAQAEFDYHDFLRRKAQVGTACGFEPNYIPDFLYPFQRSLVEWAIRKGRAAVFADCGL